MKTLDRIDRGILKLLETDGTLTHKEVAHQLHRSVNSISARVRSLEHDGYIKGYVAVIDHKKVGKELIAYTQVHVERHTREALADYKAEVIKLPEVMECYQLTGSFDFLLRIACKDMEEYNIIFNQKLSALPQVGNMQSLFVMSAPKQDPRYMFDDI